MTREVVHVVAAVIVNRDDQVLLALRPDHVHQGGLWEFPGGKVESGESPVEALARELQEELALTLVSARPLIQVLHHYSDKSILLDVWYVDGIEGDAQGCEGQLIRWVDRSQLDTYSFPAANLPILSALKLPTSYFITPDPGVFQKQADFLAGIERALDSGVRLVQLRAKHMAAESLKDLSVPVLTLCRRYQARLLINDAVELAQDVGAEGAHLSSRSLMSLKQRPVDEGFLLAASCHNQFELEHACAIGVDFVVLAPVQETTSHPHAQALGWQGFQALAKQASLPVYALGGMNAEDHLKAWQCGAQGIAGISAFWSDN